MATISVANDNRRGTVFYSSNISAKTVSAVGTAMTGLILHNPYDSKTKLVLVDAGFVWTTVPAAVHQVGIGVSRAIGLDPTAVTLAGSPARSADGSNMVSKGRVYDAATFAIAPVAVRWFLNALRQAADATLLTVKANTGRDVVDGSIVLVPGASLALIGLTTPAVGVGAFTWSEYPM